MKLLLRVLVVTMLSAWGVGCRDSSGANGGGTSVYRITQPAPDDVAESASALLASCEEAGIPLRDSLVSSPGGQPVESLLGQPVHPSVRSWFSWMDGLGLAETSKRPLEFPPGASFLSRRGVQELLSQPTTHLGAPGFEGSRLVPVSGMLATVSVECDPESPLYGAVVASSERGWNGVQFHPSLVAYLNFLRACVQEEAITWDGDRDMLIVDFQKVRVIEAELGIATAGQNEEDD